MQLNQLLSGISQMISDRYRGTEVHTTIDDGDYLLANFLPACRLGGGWHHARCTITMIAGYCQYDIDIGLHGLPIEHTNPKSLAQFKRDLDHILALANPAQRRRPSEKGRQ